MGMRKGQTHYTEEFKKKVLADVRRKEISVRGYSKKHGISHWTMRKWIKKEN